MQVPSDENQLENLKKTAKPFNTILDSDNIELSGMTNIRLSIICKRRMWRMKERREYWSIDFRIFIFRLRRSDKTHSVTVECLRQGRLAPFEKLECYHKIPNKNNWHWSMSWPSILHITPSQLNNFIIVAFTFKAIYKPHRIMVVVYDYHYYY